MTLRLFGLGGRCRLWLPYTISLGGSDVPSHRRRLVWFSRQNMSACFTCENEVSATSTLTFSGARRMSGWYPRRIPGPTRCLRPSRYMSQAENRLLFSRKRCFSHLLGPGARYRSIWAGARVTGLCLGYKTSLVGVAGQNRGRCRFFNFFFVKNEVVANPP